MGTELHYFAPAPRGLEQLLAQELRTLGASAVAVRPLGAAFAGGLEVGYRACLWSRVADRVLVEIGRIQAADADALYQAALALAWHDHLPRGATFAVDFTQRRSGFEHGRYAALRLKDAVVDQLRARRGERPDVDPRHPGVRLRAHAAGDQVTLYVDLEGEALHRRGYRREGGSAPLRENVAAALLLRAGWAEIAAAGGALHDPVCGAGTFLVEGALIAADVAPGLHRAEARREPGVWPGHELDAWRRVRDEARARARPLRELPPIVGVDVDAAAVALARRSVERAGLAGAIRIERRDLSEGHLLFADAGPGLVIANPPYGERLGQVQRLKPLYASLGETLRRHFGGWRAAVLTADDGLAQSLGLRPRRRFRVSNGDLECRFLVCEMLDEQERTRRAEAGEARRAAAALASADDAGADAQAFANRLRKNLRALERWARREGVSCYRVYDADLPDYALAIDLYEGAAHVQEYAPPRSVDPARARARRTQARHIIPEVLGISPRDLYFKERRRQRGASQYQRRAAPAEFRTVREGGYSFLVNLSEYLDTGLFLDGREVRARLRALADGRRFLNLFAYTATATVYAAKGGARSTISLDLSPTYLSWAERNLSLNEVRGPRHQLLRTDCLRWLRAPQERYDLIYLAPPRFSRSKAMARSFDLQRDHAELLRAATRLLAPAGLLIFEVSARRFRLDDQAVAGLHVADVSRRTLPRDFRRGRAWRVWEISR